MPWLISFALGLLMLRTLTKNYKMKNSFSYWDPNLGHSAYKASELLELINIVQLKVTAFYLSIRYKLHETIIHLVLPALFLESLTCISLI